MTNRIKTLGALGALALLGPHAIGAAGLEQNFVSPPDATKPRCYWYWMDGNYNKEGITKDLEAMRRVGIGEAYIGIISGQSNLPAGDVKALSEPFWGIMTHTMREGTRLGVDIGVFNAPGWSQSGGPWIKPEQSMRRLALPEIRVHGPQHFTGKLPKPESDFQDVALLAFPAPKGDADSIASLHGKISKDAASVTMDFPQPVTVRSLTVSPSNAVNVGAELQASQDGKDFQPVRKFSIDRHNLGVEVGPVPLAPVVVSFPATTARAFRVVLSSPSDIGDVQISGAARVDSIAEKSLMKVFQDPLPPFNFYTWPQQPEPDSLDRVIALKSVVDLSKNLRPDGSLDWNVPAGDWVVQRIGMVPTGVKNSPAPPEATGLEVDKMNRAALKTHFDSYIGELIKRVPAAQRKSWKHVVADSYEKGPQNWTDGFAVLFKQHYGYDPIPFLPVLAGRMVGGAEVSNRFLWDLRRLIADRIAIDYVGGLRELCHANGLKMWLENYGHWGFPSEFLLYGGNCDEISGEFWEAGDLGSVELRLASSAAHIYGKTQVFAEAWTGGPMDLSTPWSLKKRGDWAMCQGINQFVFHVYIQQPWDDRKPGVNAGFGTEFNRNNTWFELMGGWVDYLRRCTVGLQAGVHVADVAYFIGEDTPKMNGIRQPELPPGYDFDYINADVLLNRAKVEHGQLVLADGMSFRLLVLPRSETMRPETLAKIKSFAEAGLAVLGPLPLRSPSLQGYPACDDVVKRLAAELKGRVHTDDNIQAALQVPPDLGGIDPAKILYIHRRDRDTDLYFLSNQTDAPVLLNPAFRVTGKVAELWHPDTGAVEQMPSEDGGGVTKVAVPLASRGSVFVVFRSPAKSGESIVSLTRDGRPVVPTFPKLGIKILKATYGVPGDASRSRNVQAKMQTLLDQGGADFAVGQLAAGDDPALNVLKTLSVEYTLDGLPGKAIGTDSDTIRFGLSGESINRIAEVRSDSAGRLGVWANQPGSYEVKTVSGKKMSATIAAISPPVEVTGPWNVSFPPKWGAPEKIVFDKLASFTDSTNSGVKYFSGTATYAKTFDWRPTAPIGKQIPEVWLDLGDVREVAQVKLNGRDLGTVWRPPFRVNVTGALQPGRNTVEISVANLWRNRMIGDAASPSRKPFTWSSSAHFSADTPLPKAGLLGPVTILTKEIVPLL